MMTSVLAIPLSFIAAPRDLSTETTLREHKENDLTRSRNFFEHHMQRLLPLKREWFYSKENVDILMVDGLDKEQVGLKVKEWCDKCIADFS